MVGNDKADGAIAIRRGRNRRPGRSDYYGRRASRREMQLVVMAGKQDSLDEDRKSASERRSPAPYPLGPTDQNHSRAAPHISLFTRLS